MSVQSEQHHTFTLHIMNYVVIDEMYYNVCIVTGEPHVNDDGLRNGVFGVFFAQRTNEPTGPDNNTSLLESIGSYGCACLDLLVPWLVCRLGLQHNLTPKLQQLCTTSARSQCRILLLRSSTA